MARTKIDGTLYAEEEITVSYKFIPGTPASGHSGPPEDYDPGSGPEIEDVELIVFGQSFRLERVPDRLMEMIVEDTQAGDY